MFHLRMSESFWWPVQIRTPDDGWKVQTLQLELRHFDTDGFEAFMEEVRKDKLDDAAVCQRVVLNWRAVVDEKKAPLPFSAQSLADLCRMPGAASSIVRDFLDAHLRAAEKN